MAQRISALNLPGVLVDSDYQLQIEAAAELGHCRRVIFVDADRSAPEPFSLRRLEPTADGLSFSTHSVSPGALLALARDVFQAEPEAWILGIRGYDFDAFGEGLSSKATENLAAATEHLKTAIRTSR